MPPYNTRRKSLSLSELGIVLPKRSRAAEHHPSPPETVVESDEPPVKRSKRAHSIQSTSMGLMSPPRTMTVRIKEENPHPVSTLSPPPSPATESYSKVDIEGINDDIVIATIQQLENTGNRPHMVKELAAVLANNLHSVEKCAPSYDFHAGVANKIIRSANPNALISSRLTAYLNRPWPAISPCPLAKDLSSAHPRRLYFFLTTTPRQPIPTVADAIPKVSHIISPSISSASADEEDPRFARGRQAMSPSPEVDLSSPDLDDTNVDAPPTPGGSFSGRNSLPRDRPSFLASSRRATSPQLEYEERDFKQTASQLYEQAQARRNSQNTDVNMADDTDVDSRAADLEANIKMSIERAEEETEESAARKESEALITLFGPVDHLRLSAFSISGSGSHIDFSSPVIQPQTDSPRYVAKDSPRDEPMEGNALDLDKHSLPDSAFPWDEDHLDPEDINVEDLEDMFDSY